MNSAQVITFNVQKKTVLRKYNVKNFEILIILFFDNFVSAPLQSLISQELLDGNEKFFLPFEADKIAFNNKYFVSKETN